MKYNIEELRRDGFIVLGEKRYLPSEIAEMLFAHIMHYEKALEEITRQYDYTSVNRAKEIANEALGELTLNRRKEIQSQ